jgi:hypothetical protein
MLLDGENDARIASVEALFGYNPHAQVIVLDGAHLLQTI